MEFLTFGTIIKIYHNLISLDLRKSIAEKYGIFSPNIFYNYVNSVKEIRNACAHGSVLFDFTLPLSISKGPAFNYHEYGKNNLYASILVIKYLLSRISNNRAIDLENEIEALFEKHKPNPIINSIIENNIGYKFK